LGGHFGEDWLIGEAILKEGRKGGNWGLSWAYLKRKFIGLRFKVVGKGPSWALWVIPCALGENCPGLT